LPETRTVRSSDLIGRTVLGADGAPIGRIADLELDGDTVVAALVVAGRWGRLLGYERDSSGGPWLLETFASLVLRRDRQRLTWDEIRLADRTR
jgi:hypothetical protein